MQQSAWVLVALWIWNTASAFVSIRSASRENLLISASPRERSFAVEKGNTKAKWRATTRRQPSGTKRRRPSRRLEQITRLYFHNATSDEINQWMHQVVATNASELSDLSPRDETDLVRVLRDQGAYQAIDVFVRNVSRKNAFTFTAAMSAMAWCPAHHPRALQLLDEMDRHGIAPTSYTLEVVFYAVHGADAVLELWERIQKQYPPKLLTAQVFNAAIYACSRQSPSASSNTQHQPSQERLDWQAALYLFQEMRRQRLKPTPKTYTSLLHVFAQTGQVRIAMSLLDEMLKTSVVNDRVWGAALNVCAQAGDYMEALNVLQRMHEHHYQPNLHHCTSLLKALSRADGTDEFLALQVLDVLTGKRETMDDQHAVIPLPQLQPDKILLNTVLGACSNAGNYDEAKKLLGRMRDGEFRTPRGGEECIFPDEISYNTVLSVCPNSTEAQLLVQEMRLSRRYRVGVVTPNSVTFANAISACGRGSVADLDSARNFLKLARDDGIKPTVFMFSAAIWVAERAEDPEAALLLLKEMQAPASTCEPNVVSYNGVISALASQGRYQDAFGIYQEMKANGVAPNRTTFQRLLFAVRNSNITANDKGDELARIFSELDPLEKCVNLSGPIAEALITFYGSKGLYENAREIFDQIEGPSDKPCLRAVLFACSTAVPPRYKEALSLLHSSDITAPTGLPGNVDVGALSHTIIACSKADEWEEAFNVLQLYGASSTNSQVCESVSNVAINSLIAACGRGGRPDVAIRLLNAMESLYNVVPDERSYRNAIIACNQAEHRHRSSQSGTSRDAKSCPRSEEPDEFHWWECAISLLRRMKEDGLYPDLQTLSSAISACEAAGEWQRALGILASEMETGNASNLNLYCFNAAISACEKGGAWVEALDIYERLKEEGGSLRPNFVTLNSLIVALNKAGQKELAQHAYIEGIKSKIVNPWRWTKDSNGVAVKAMDLHKFSSAFAKAAIRAELDSYLCSRRRESDKFPEDLTIITGKGLHGSNTSILMPTVRELLKGEFGINGKLDPSNSGRLLIDAATLREFVERRTW